MDHQYAAQNYAVEQYLLGEMNPVERREFEEHYFSCPECADAVRTGAYFADNTQFAFKDQARRPIGTGQVVEMKTRPRPSLWQRLSLAAGVAAAVLLAIAGYQSLAGRKTGPPQLLARSVIHPAARGTGDVIVLKPGQKTAVLRLDLNSERPYPYYAVDLQDQAGKSILQQRTEAPADGALELSSIPAGLYGITVRGQTSLSDPPGPVVESVKFAVKNVE